MAGVLKGTLLTNSSAGSSQTFERALCEQLVKSGGSGI
jgi:hypothetical protein